MPRPHASNVTHGTSTRVACASTALPLIDQDTPGVQI